MSETWKAKVYKKPLKRTRGDNENWIKLRRFILDRDRQTCYRCDKYFRAQNDLSVHHLVPRVDGGSDDPSNLITLCHRCHDYAEIHGLKTLADIAGSYEDESIKTIRVEKGQEREESFTRPEWHKYVYGGVKKCTQ